MKTNILIPLAGKGQRFVDVGYTIPKSLIRAGDKSILDWSLSSLDLTDCNLIFVIRNEHILNYSLDEILKEKYGEDITIVKSYKDTKGSVESCLLAQQYIHNDNPLLVYCIDIHFQQVFQPNKVDRDLDGLILTFQSNSPNYSYSEIDKNGYVTRVAEKSVISNRANVGAYWFKSGSLFIEASKIMIKRDDTVNGEFYIAPVYNYLNSLPRFELLNNSPCIKHQEVEKMYVMGTPAELDFYSKYVLNKFGDGKVALCSDHSGFDLKEKTKEILTKNNIAFIDYGTYSSKNCDQVDYTKMACDSLEKGICNYGIGFCRTGQAINITSNSYKGILGSLVYDEYSAEYAIRHNASNFFCISSKNILVKNMKNIIEIWKNTTFDGGRHQVRVQKILGLKK